MSLPEEPQFLYLTTVGRRSGLPREIEIWFTRREGRYYVIAEHGERAQWIRNLRENPDVKLRLGNAASPARARVIDPAEEPELNATVQERSRQKYGWGEGLVVELAPVSEES